MSPVVTTMRRMTDIPQAAANSSDSSRNGKYTYVGVDFQCSAGTARLTPSRF